MYRSCVEQSNVPYGGSPFVTVTLQDHQLFPTMPRRRQPKSLESLSWAGVATNVVRSRQEPEEVEAYRRKIPPVMANRYTEELLKSASATPVDPAGSLRSAFHPDCCVVQLSKLFKLSCYAWRQLFTNLDTMPGLTMLKISQVPTWESHIVVVDMLVRHLPVLQKLTSVAMARTVGVAITRKMANVEQTTNLPPHVQMYANCADLRHLDIDISELAPEGIICLLDNLPQLKSLPIHTIERVLPLCRRSYGLADFSGLVRDTKDLNRIGRHFPQLETLRLNASYTTLTCISNLPRLQTLQLCYKPRGPLHDLMTPCISRLTRLFLQNVTMIDSVFRRDLDTTYPLTSLTFDSCSDIDLVGIAKSLPKLEKLVITRSSFTELTGTDLTPCPFRHVTECIVLGSPQGWTKSHDRYLLSSCTKLRKLSVTGNYSITDADFCELIAANPMKELDTLTLICNDLTIAVVATILSSFGDSLDDVYLEGSNLSELLSDADVAELASQCRMYDMDFTLSGHEICVAES